MRIADISDLADAFAKALDYNGEKSIFNISSGMGVNLNELIAEIETALGCSFHRKYLTSRPFDVPTSILENTLARQELNWFPTVGLREGIIKTIDWLRTEDKNNYSK